MFRAGLLLCAALLPASLAHAESLKDALAAAYESNPELAAARAGQMVTDERAAEAVAASRPTLSSTSAVNQEFPNPGEFGDRSRLVTSNIGVRQSLYRGGQTKNAIRSADIRVDAGLESLRATENRILLAVVAAYLDVQRDQAEVELTRLQVRVLEEQLRASRDRFAVGDLTRTDVAQSEARLATAMSSSIAARARLTASREAYRRVVGRMPGTLEPLPPLPVLPGTAAQALDRALANSPVIRMARLEEKAARTDIAAAKGARLPALDATASVGYTNFRGTANGTAGLRTSGIDYTQNVGLQLTVPLYQGGAVGARIRQAEARQSQALASISVIEREEIERTQNAYEQVEAARALIRAAQSAVDSSRLALEGVRTENQVGTRTVLDVLNAEQEALNAEVSLIRARRDEYVAAYALLAAMGDVEASRLDLPVTAYNAADNAVTARKRWFDWDTGVAPTTGVMTQPTAPVAGPPAP